MQPAGAGWSRSCKGNANGSRGGRSPAFDPDHCTSRNVVERCFDRLDEFRGLTTCRTNRTAYHHSETIIAAIMLRLRADLPDPD